MPSKAVVKVTNRMLREAQAEAVRRFGRSVTVGVAPRGAAVGQHGEYVPGPKEQRNGQLYYVCARCRTEHPLTGWRDQYIVREDQGRMFSHQLGAGFSFAEAFAAAEALRKALPAVVPLPAPNTVARMPQERRSRVTSTSTIPLTRRVTGQQQTSASRARCQECGAVIAQRTRCNRCALRAWRAQHPNAKRTQDERYRSKRPGRVRALVRARVAAWRHRHQRKK